MIAELWSWLLVSTLASSVAIVLVLLLRWPVRRLFGSRAVSWLWFLPAAMLIACWLPAPAQPVRLLPVFPDLAMVNLSGSVAEKFAASVNASGIATGMIVVAWLLGAAVLAVRFGYLQRRLRRQLGTLISRGDGTWQASALPEFGPAVLGVLPARIVLPQSFEKLWDAAQRDLVLAHERCHIQRGDLWVQLLAVIWLCLFWFNPLVHLAVRRLRVDQELACDATVVQRNPAVVRDYAQALLATTAGAAAVPLCSAWTDPAPLKERIQMLNHALVSRFERRLGACVVIGVVLTSAAVAWSTHASGISLEPVTAPENAYQVDLELARDFQSANPQIRRLQILTVPGEETVVSSDDLQNPWRLSLRVTPGREGRVKAELSMDAGPGRVASPSLEFMPNEEVSIVLGSEFRIILMVVIPAADIDPARPAGPASRA